MDEAHDHGSQETLEWGVLAIMIADLAEYRRRLEPREQASEGALEEAA